MIVAKQSPSTSQCILSERASSFIITKIGQVVREIICRGNRITMVIAENPPPTVQCILIDSAGSTILPKIS